MLAEAFFACANVSLNSCVSAGSTAQSPKGFKPTLASTEAFGVLATRSTEDFAEAGLAESSERLAGGFSLITAASAPLNAAPAIIGKIIRWKARRRFDFMTFRSILDAVIRFTFGPFFHHSQK